MAGLKGVSEESDVISERRQRALQLSELAVQLREEGREQRKKGRRNCDNYVHMDQ